MPKFPLRTWSALVACLIIGALVISACGGDDDDSDNGDSTPTPDASEEPTETPVEGGETETPGFSGTPSAVNAPIQLSEFTIAPSVSRAEAGTVTFQVTNAGEFPHEFVVIKSDLPIAQLPRLGGEEGVDEDEVEIVDRLEPIDPGATGVLVAQMDDGTYVLICNLASGGESHYLNGMYDQFTVGDLPGPPPVVTPVPLQ